MCHGLPVGTYPSLPHLLLLKAFRNLNNTDWSGNQVAYCGGKFDGSIMLHSSPQTYPFILSLISLQRVDRAQLMRHSSYLFMPNKPWDICLQCCLPLKFEDSCNMSMDWTPQFSSGQNGTSQNMPPSGCSHPLEVPWQSSGGQRE